MNIRKVWILAYLAVVLLLTILSVVAQEKRCNRESARCNASDIYNGTEFRPEGCWFFPEGESILQDREVEYEGYDGFYNNLAHPDLGAVDTPLVRILPPAYSDGSYDASGLDRPNPFKISDMLFKGETGHLSNDNKTALLVFFGQQVVEEILDAQRPGCPPEYLNIKIPEWHEHNKENDSEFVMPFLRSRYDMRTGFSPNNPRQQLNEITAYFDGGLTYGTTKAWADALREFKNGRLKKEEDEKFNFPEINRIRLPMANPPPPRDQKSSTTADRLKNVNRFFKLGNPRGNENPFLLTFGILWFRWHNYLAAQIKNCHNDWSDEKIFNEARKWVIATHQKIVVYDWLPQWIGQKLPDYEHYKPDVDPGISAVFQSAAMRFGHTLVPPGVYRRNADCQFRKTSSETSGGLTELENRTALRTCNSFWNPQESIRESNIDEFLMGMASQITEREDNIITPDLRGNVFGPLEFSRRDLMAVNIQRGRDHGLPDYMTARKYFNLTVYDTLTDWFKAKVENKNDGCIDNDSVRFPLLNDTDLQNKLIDLYNESGIDKIDIWPGGILETRHRCPGELFVKIISDQFCRIRDGDRFWFENTNNGLFTKEEIDVIRNVTLWDIIISVTHIPENMDDGGIQDDPFHWLSTYTIGSKNVTYAGPCPMPGPVVADNLDDCTELQHFDYFSGSEVSYALTFTAVGLFTIGCVVLLIVLAKHREKQVVEHRKMIQASLRKKHSDVTIIPLTEWQGKEDGNRTIQLKLGPGKELRVLNERGRLLRSIDLSHAQSVMLEVSVDKGHAIVGIKIPREYDLVVKLPNQTEQTEFIEKFEQFLGEIGIGRERRIVKQNQIFTSAYTKRHRQTQLEKFFRVAFAQAFHLEHDRDEAVNLNSEQAKEVLQCELTKAEFAEALSMRPDTTFVEQMFNLIDKDNKGFINFREFLDMMCIFTKGTPDAKGKLLFDMYDINQKGHMSRDEFRNMLRSFMELANEKLSNDEIDQVILSLFQTAGLESKQEISFDDFQKLLSGHQDVLNAASLNWEGAGVAMPNMPRENAPTRARKTIIRAYSKKDHGTPDSSGRSSSLKVETQKQMFVKSAFSQLTMAWVRYIENHRMHIFWLILYTLVLTGVFVERAYYFSVEREHAGLRRIAGYGVTVTRGAASAMMFTYSSLLVTMCRNTITFFRETFLHRFIPFDAAIAMHKYIAAWALFYTVMHCIGHAINFYHISTQTANDLTCLFRNFFHATHELPKFHYWCWQTITGVTGVLVTLLVIVMYVFAIQYARRHVFNWFWLTHNMYIILYILMILHGIGRLVQDAFFFYFFLGPAILFTLDTLVSISRKKVEISVMKAELLPSDVTCLVFKRPQNFEYKSGQWVRIACLTQGANEYHPFTLTSAPHEEHLSLYIRAVGPWTINLRTTYDPNIIREHPYPKLYLDGPYGEGHQDWYKFEVAVLVGGGIGVTPFASILKDLVFKSGVGHKFSCKKIFFLWVTRTQKQFEWMTDIIREVEEKDMQDLVSVHIFITQFYQKFDLRTTMLYVCESHFQKISGRSLFTGLKSKTHFGRPCFSTFLASLQDEFPEVNKFGVFSCGPPLMTRAVETACTEQNNKDGPAFLHHYENF